MDIVEFNNFQLPDDRLNEIKILEPEENQEVLQEDLLYFSSDNLYLVFPSSFLW